MTSACRGEARNTIPNLSKSYLDAAACIISTAQHANPNVKGHIEPEQNDKIFRNSKSQNLIFL
jgi:hypothetical protein